MAVAHTQSMIRFLTTLLLFALPTAVAAQSMVKNPNVRVELIAESSVPAPGRPVTLGIVLTPKPGWHTYWKNPGDAGLEPRVAWTLPGGAAAEPLRYPVPGTLLLSGLMNYVYEKPATLLADFTVPALPAGTALPVGLKLDYLVCSAQMCVPESATLRLDLRVGSGAPDPVAAPRLAAARAALPKIVDWPAHYRIDNGRFVLAVPFGNPAKVRSAYFFAAADGSVDYSSPQAVSIAGDAVRIETKAGAKVPGKAGGPITGVLSVTRDGEPPLGFAVTALPGAVPAAGAALARTDEGGGQGHLFLSALLLAVVGGVILNVMPCVFPILSLKALSLAKGAASPKQAQRDALAYAAGVIAVCVALGGLILGLRAGGAQIGWAFQLQNPRVIFALLLLMTAIALNLAGLFEFASVGAGQSLASKPGAAGSFWTGALAAFVATPCTGPFMAGALGAALVLPPLAGLLVFAGLGLGLALPFLAIGFVPALRRRLPKPGAWMATFRHLLSVPMFLTALALAWVLGRQTGVDGMVGGLAGALVIALMLWWLGLRQRGMRSGGRLPLMAGSLVALAVVQFVPLPPADKAAATADAPAGLATTPFSEASLVRLQAAHTPTFVYFTADWCLTCKVNERGALSSSAVAGAFAKAGVKVLVGDWTSGDPVLGRFIEQHGRAGVPLYLFYHADGRVEELPQLLTVGGLVGLTA